MEKVLYVLITSEAEYKAVCNYLKGKYFTWSTGNELTGDDYQLTETLFPIQVLKVIRGYDEVIRGYDEVMVSNVEHVNRNTEATKFYNLRGLKELLG